MDFLKFMERRIRKLQDEGRYDTAIRLANALQRARNEERVKDESYGQD
jgi:hypothetical protein